MKLGRSIVYHITVPKGLRAKLLLYCKKKGGNLTHFIPPALHYFLGMDQERLKKILKEYGDLTLTKALRTKKYYYEPLRDKLEKRISVQFSIPRFLVEELENFCKENKYKRAHITSASIYHFLSLNKRHQGEIVTQFGEYCLARVLKGLEEIMN